jgi:acetate---CoA ligase (ADP-forming)
MTKLRSVDFKSLFDPQSIAVVGASNKAGKMGNLFITRLAASYRGALYPINPNECEIAGIPAKPSFAAIEAPIDLLVALVPASRLIEVVESIPAGQVRHLLAIPSGFGEASADRAVGQQRMAESARKPRVRILGPNIVGIMNGITRLNASMMPEVPPGGRGLSCITQSGGFGMALSMYMLDHQLPFAKFCDLGNMSDVQVYELLDYLSDDDDTQVIGLFLEAAGDAEAFSAALERALTRKPVVVCPVGGSQPGRRASLAHLGIASGISAMEGKWPPQAVLTETGLDLLNAAKTLMWQKQTKGKRCAILTGTGGIGAELADLAIRHGLQLPEFSDTVAEKIGRDLPQFAATRNPVDFTPIWWEYQKHYPHALKTIAEAEVADCAIVSITDVATTNAELVEALASWARANKSLPSVIYWGARDRDRPNMRALEAAGLPCYRSTREAVLAAAAMTKK